MSRGSTSTADSKGKATLNEVAKAAGVHPSTVSRVLDERHRHRISPATVERVMDAVDRLGYRMNSAARDLRRGHSGMVGLVVASLTDPLVPPLLRAIEQPLLAAGLIPIIVESNNDSKTLARVLDMLWTRSIDGLVMTCVRDGDLALVSKLNRDIPVVLAIRRFEQPRFHSIVHDDAEGASLVAEHFASLGHKSVAQLGGPSDMSSFRGRGTGFAKACLDLSLNLHEIEGVANNYTVDEGDRLARVLFDEHPDVTAVFAHNDAVAAGVVRATRALGMSCPRDVSIAGYNDAPLSDLFSPALTTVRVAIDDVAAHASSRLLQLLEDPGLTPTALSVVPELVVRESTGPARK